MPSPTILVTGANGGLGRYVTDACLEAGYSVCAIDLDWRDAHRSPDSRLRRIEADLTSRAAVDDAVAKARKDEGPIHALLHLVGGFDAGSRVEDTTDELWESMLDVNLRTAVNMMRATIPAMREQGSGRIVTVGSTAALEPVVTWGAFSVAVGAMVSLVRVAAAELRDEGVTVNALLPTTIDTPVVREFCGSQDAPKWVDPRSLASLMLWLCSEAGRDVTGAALPVPGRQPHPCLHFHGESD